MLPRIANKFPAVIVSIDARAPAYFIPPVVAVLGAGRMKRVARVAVLGIVGVVAAAYSPAAADVIRSQPPCTPESGERYCVRFDSDDPIPVLRTFEFNAPSPGRAQVTFHGTMMCGNSETARRFFQFVSQIVRNPSAFANSTGPGGLSHDDSLEAASGGIGPRQFFNLASTRVFRIRAAGQQVFHFKLDKLRMDSGIECLGFNATFSIIFASSR